MELFRVLLPLMRRADSAGSSGALSSFPNECDFTGKGNCMRRIQALCCLLLLGVTGCDFFVPQTNSGGGTNTGDYLYVGNGNNTYIAGFGVSSAGALSVLTSSPYNNGVAAQSLAVTPANTFLYAGTTNGIYVYAINSDGSITVQNSGNAAAQDVVPTAMQVDSTGGYLLAAGIGTSIGAQAIGIYQIDSTTGLLTALTGSPLALYTGNGHHRDGGDANRNADYPQQLVRLRLARLAGRASADTRHRGRPQHRHRSHFSSAALALRPARRIMGWQVIPLPRFYLWPRSIPGCAC